MKFAVIGGDQRIASLARLLVSDGHKVSAFALDKAGILSGTNPAASAAEAVEGAECVVLPLPAAGQRGLLNAPLSAGEYPLDEVLDVLKAGSVVCAGLVDAQTAGLARERGIEIFDYFQREELVIKNAVATAEGAVGIIIQETAETLWCSRALVLGFGRIGKLLAHRLHGLGAKVSVSARSFADIAWIEAMGYRPVGTYALEGNLGAFDMVINTIPSPVLGEAELRELKEGALCLDLASKPGGMDFAAASRLGVKAIWALGLPAEVAPMSSGAIVKDTIYNILEERNGEN